MIIEFIKTVPVPGNTAKSFHKGQRLVFESEQAMEFIKAKAARQVSELISKNDLAPEEDLSLEDVLKIMAEEEKPKPKNNGKKKKTTKNKKS